MENNYDPFVHLHCHTDYSLYDGFQKYSSLVDRAKELNMKAVAVTDHGKVGSFIKFYKACKAAGIKPIFGIEGYISHDLSNKKSNRYHLTMLAKNKTGYENLLKISSESHKHLVKVGKNEIPRVNLDILKEHSEGLIVLSGCIVSEFSRLILDDEIDEAEKLARQYKDIWGDDYYTEIMWTKYEPQKKQAAHAIQIANKIGNKIIATNDVHFTRKEESKYQKIKISISRNGPYFDDGSNSEYYLKSYNEMLEIFKSKPEVLHNTIDIADKCNVEIDLGAAQLPHFEIPRDNVEFEKYKLKFPRSTEEEIYLHFLSEEGLKVRGKYEDSKYRERLEKELETIRFTGFTRYFLIVYEYVAWAKENDILVGVGRGSGAGSLVLYCLGVTGVDPIKYDLSMDRFLYAEAKYRLKAEDFLNHSDREKNMHGEDCVCSSCNSRNKDSLDLKVGI